MVPGEIEKLNNSEAISWIQQILGHMSAEQKWWFLSWSKPNHTNPRRFRPILRPFWPIVLAKVPKSKWIWFEDTYPLKQWVFLKYWSHFLTNLKNIILVRQTCAGSGDQTSDVGSTRLSPEIRDQAEAEILVLRYCQPRPQSYLNYKLCPVILKYNFSSLIASPLSKLSWLLKCPD